MKEAGHHSAHGPEAGRTNAPIVDDKPETAPESDTETQPTVHSHGRNSVAAQIIGVAILEFGVVFHSVLVGLTLAVDEAFKVLFIVITFHRESYHLLSGSVSDSTPGQKCLRV